MSEYNKNDYRILGNNGKKMVFKIPVGNMTPAEAKKELEKLMADYKEPIDIMSDPYSTYTHPVMVCGATGPVDNIKDYWIPTRVLGLQEPTNLPGHRNPPPPPTHSTVTNPTIISKIPVEKKKSWFRKLFS